MGRTQAFRRLALATLLLSIKPELGSMHLLQRITQGTTSGTLLAVGFCCAISIAFSAGPLSRSLSGGNAVDGCPMAAARRRQPGSFAPEPAERATGLAGLARSLLGGSLLPRQVAQLRRALAACDSHRSFLEPRPLSAAEASACA